MTEDMPYRPCAGAVLFNRQGLVWVGRRADQHVRGIEAWQLPQGGIDAGEAPAQAVLRELAEEIGTSRAEILAEHPDWLQYDLPAELLGTRIGQRFRGQRQRWFALRFTGEDQDVRLDAHLPAEFDAWRWIPLAEVPALAVPFKRDIYTILARDFAGLAAALAGGGAAAGEG